jgi:uncharacterized membrane protein
MVVMSVTVTFNPAVAYLVVGAVLALLYAWVAIFEDDRASLAALALWLIGWPVLAVIVVVEVERERRRIKWLKRLSSNPTPSPRDLLRS